MRRMQEMARLQPGMSFYGDLPEGYNVILNYEHPLLQRLLQQEKSEVEPKLAELRASLAEEQAKIAAEEKALEGQETKTSAELDTLRAKKSELEGQINSQLNAFGENTLLVGQLIDLALLSHGLLSGEALAAFIRRSQSLL